VERVASWATVDQLNRPNLDDAMTVRRVEASGLGIGDDLAHSSWLVVGTARLPFRNAPILLPTGLHIHGTNRWRTPTMLECLAAIGYTLVIVGEILIALSRFAGHRFGPRPEAPRSAWSGLGASWLPTRPSPSPRS
jgi:hypothetical protein